VTHSPAWTATTPSWSPTRSNTRPDTGEPTTTAAIGDLESSENGSTDTPGRSVSAKAGIGYTALDNGFRSCDDPAALQRICDRLGPGAVKSFFWRWLYRLPSPFTTADLRAGYVYELAFRQFEVSDTRVFDRPAAGRAFFEQVIRDHLDVGRPSWR